MDGKNIKSGTDFRSARRVAGSLILVNEREAARVASFVPAQSEGWLR